MALGARGVGSTFDESHSDEQTVVHTLTHLLDLSDFDRLKD